MNFELAKFLAEPKGPPEPMTKPGQTQFWDCTVPHIVVNGLTLTPRIQMDGTKPRTIAGWPLVETIGGRIVYAVPGGGSYVVE